MSTSNSSSSQSPLMAPAVAAINHLLAQESWARDALMPHAGKEACIDASGIDLRLCVTRDGMVETGHSDASADVTIRVKLADLPLIAQNRERAFSYVKIEGDAEFANTISHLGRGLRWEAEHDIERFLGPIAANRLVGGARSLVETARASQQKVAENVAEFLTEEQPVLVRPVMVDDYASEVSRLRDDVERAAKRIARLESRLAARDAAPDTTEPVAARAGQQKLDL